MTLGCAAATAHADSVSDHISFEGGIAATSATKLGDGMFYSKGFAHGTPNASIGGRVGIVFNAIDAAPRSWKPGVRFHLDYENFGKVEWWSINPQDSSNFPDHNGGYDTATQSCVDNNCGTFRRFDSTGGIQAISLTIEPYWNLGSNWTIGLEAGPALYRSTWTSIAISLADGPFGPAGTEQTLSHNPKIQVGVLAGASISKGPLSMRLNYLYAPVGKLESNDVPSGIKGEWMLSANYTF
jgi:hypothetical protein